jgi:hypothetical protein
MFLGHNSVSQREIQRCFNLIDFFWKMRYDDEIENGNDRFQPNPIRCIALSLALTYYFRLPTAEDNAQRNDRKTPSREDLGQLLSETIPNFVDIIQLELAKFVNTNNFVIPQGVAINQAVCIFSVNFLKYINFISFFTKIREHIFSIIISIATRTPLCIIGAPGQTIYSFQKYLTTKQKSFLGQSKTLSFQIVVQNLQGPQLSTKAFCKRLPAVDPFFCLGSKYTRSEDIAYVFERAIKREQHYEQNRVPTQCVSLIYSIHNQFTNFHY